MKAAYAKYIIALLLFGSNGLVASFIDLSSQETVLFRTLLGSITMAVIFIAARKKFTFTHYRDRYKFASTYNCPSQRKPYKHKYSIYS